MVPSKDLRDKVGLTMGSSDERLIAIEPACVHIQISDSQQASQRTGPHSQSTLNEAASLTRARSSTSTPLMRLPTCMMNIGPTLVISVAELVQSQDNLGAPHILQQIKLDLYHTLA